MKSLPFLVIGLLLVAIASIRVIEIALAVGGVALIVWALWVADGERR